jgi:hypothetical protein
MTVLVPQSSLPYGAAAFSPLNALEQREINFLLSAPTMKARI